MVKLNEDEILIISGSRGGKEKIERYHGARTKAAIRSRISRERRNGSQDASAWVVLLDQGLGSQDGGTRAYGKLTRSLDVIEETRVVSLDAIEDNPAAALAATKRGRSPQSIANGKKGGRPPRQFQDHAAICALNHGESSCTCGRGKQRRNVK